MRMQQEDADPLAKVDEEDDSAATKQTLEALTRLEDEGELERFLSFGKWGLTPEDIVRLQKDEEMKQRVSIYTLLPILIAAKKPLQYIYIIPNLTIEEKPESNLERLVIQLPKYVYVTLYLISLRCTCQYLKYFKVTIISYTILTAESFFSLTTTQQLTL